MDITSPTIPREIDAIKQTAVAIPRFQSCSPWMKNWNIAMQIMKVVIETLPIMIEALAIINQ